VDNEVVNIGQPAAVLDLTITSTDDVNCFGGNDGSITTNTVGGTPGYSWTINGNPGGPNFGGLTAGVYNIQVIDQNNCVDNEVVNIGQPAAALTVSGVAVNPTCHNYTNGQIDITVQGGTPQYQYNWSNGVQTEDIDQLTSGIYQVQVLDANGCATSAQFEIINPLPIVLEAEIKDILCHGLTNGYIDVQVSGGVEPYQYVWSNGANTQDLTNIGAGIYTLTLIDHQNCMAQGTYELEDVAPIVIQADEEYTIYVGEEVTLNAQVSGGVGGFTYLWSPADWLDCNTCLNPVASPLITTEYVLLVADANGCTNVATSTVNVLYTLYVPNTFSPNGDQLNDTFTAISRSCKEFRMMIFNRWGDKIYETDNIYQGWDGTYGGSEAKIDVYNYKIEAKFYNGEYHELIGQVNLLR